MMMAEEAVAVMVHGVEGKRGFPRLRRENYVGECCFTTVAMDDSTGLSGGECYFRSC